MLFRSRAEGRPGDFRPSIVAVLTEPVDENAAGSIRDRFPALFPGCPFQSCEYSHSMTWRAERKPNAEELRDLDDAAGRGHRQGQEVLPGEARPGPIFEDPEALHYRSGSTYFDVYPNLGAGQAEHTLACWVVDDVKRVVGELRARGVVFEEYDLPGLKTVNGVAELPTERSAWFKDSEGNILAVAQLTVDFRGES